MHSTDNLVGCVADAIARDNPAAATRFTRDFPQQSNEPAQQIKDLNRYWRSQLGQLHTSTISERSCLIDNIKPADWFRHFQKLVLPLIIRADLPRV